MKNNILLAFLLMASLSLFAQNDRAVTNQFGKTYTEKLDSLLEGLDRKELKSGIDPSLVFGIPQMGVQDLQGNYLESQQLNPDHQVKNQATELIN